MALRRPMPSWEVQVLNHTGAIRVTCPRCSFSFVTYETEWPGPAKFSTRPCPACFAASRLPQGMALIYDGHDTIVVTQEIASAWEYFQLVRYSADDGPNGIVWRPKLGVSMERLQGMAKAVTGR